MPIVIFSVIFKILISSRTKVSVPNAFVFLSYSKFWLVLIFLNKTKCKFEVMIWNMKCCLHQYIFKWDYDRQGKIGGSYMITVIMNFFLFVGMWIPVREAQEQATVDLGLGGGGWRHASPSSCGAEQRRAPPYWVPAAAAFHMASSCCSLPSSWSWTWTWIPISWSLHFPSLPFQFLL